MLKRLRWLKKLISRMMIVLISFFFMIQTIVLISLLYWQNHPVETTMFMRWTYFLDGNLDQGIYHQWRDWEMISPYVAQAIIAAEDNRFMQHHGFDWQSIENALIQNQTQGRVLRGGSTITQQLAKNLFLSNQRSWLRKGQEAIITVMIEKLWSKQRILEVYMNSVEFGDHIYGVEAAAQYYFKCHAKDLNREQAAFLAAILPQPRYYQHHQNNVKLKQRQKIILGRM